MVVCSNQVLPTKAWLLHPDSRCNNKVVKKAVLLLLSRNKEELKDLQAAFLVTPRLLSGEVSSVLPSSTRQIRFFLISCTVISIIALES